MRSLRDWLDEALGELLAGSAGRAVTQAAADGARPAHFLVQVGERLPQGDLELMEALSARAGLALTLVERAGGGVVCRTSLPCAPQEAVRAFTRLRADEDILAVRQLT